MPGYPEPRNGMGHAYQTLYRLKILSYARLSWTQSLDPIETENTPICQVILKFGLVWTHSLDPKETENTLICQGQLADWSRGTMASPCTQPLRGRVSRGHETPTAGTEPTPGLGTITLSIPEGNIVYDKFVFKGNFNIQMAIE